MTVLLLLYLCTDATRTDCQVVPAQRWVGTDAYEQCLASVPRLTNALTAKNRKRHSFVCEEQTDSDVGDVQHIQPQLTRQSFRL
ncbi:hypothetical protein C4K14_1896 [Pseudomonas chlororaphis subsp. aureofaciens]|uniref:hypothetical protein n=1 Tax=Pseudomonas chlororaphis TaxID=587753 RepID=UPI000F57519C|nr:hypothetical protein [Pseudomonas chlororaphis]AZD84730.1 hypothetical protein C4K14_1896 [Pseudomonas chlororaphis subsp. aureofaciens]